MNVSKKLIGISLATSVALAFAVSPINTAFAAQVQDVKCYGANSCKGTTACKTTTNACKGQNSCKGKGFVMAPTAEQCKTMGGSLEESKAAQ